MYNFESFIFYGFFLLITGALNSCEKEPLANYDITLNSVGYFNLGQDIASLKENPNAVFCKIKGQETVAYIEESDTLYYVSRIDRDNKIREVAVMSDKMKMRNGIHLNMNIKSLRKVYPDIAKSVRKIPILGVSEGTYLPDDYVKRDSFNLTLKGVVLRLKVVNDADTILNNIYLKFNVRK